MTTLRKPKPMPPTDALLWTEEQVAAALHVPMAVVDRERRAGRLKAVRIEDRPWCYRPADVQAYVDALAGAGTQRTDTEATIVRYRRERTG